MRRAAVDMRWVWYWMTYLSDGPCGFTFTWWGCCGLRLWNKPVEFAHSFLLCFCVYFWLYGSFNCISFHKFSRQLSAFSLCSFGLISALLVLSTMYIFLKVSLSSDIILCGWLGLKYQLSNWLTFLMHVHPVEPSHSLLGVWTTPTVSVGWTELKQQKTTSQRRWQHTMCTAQKVSVFFRFLLEFLFFLPLPYCPYCYCCSCYCGCRCYCFCCCCRSSSSVSSSSISL